MRPGIRIIALCCLWGISSIAQGQIMESLPQYFSPEAAEIGKYGKVPVSYFNGLPNITVPLTSLQAKNYSLPVYLSYHAGGNKPEQHPGWVGLGWSLHAGGRISRVINGMIDEMSPHHFYYLNGCGEKPF